MTHEKIALNIFKQDELLIVLLWPSILNTAANVPTNSEYRKPSNDLLKTQEKVVAKSLKGNGSLLSQA